MRSDAFSKHLDGKNHGNCVINLQKSGKLWNIVEKGPRNRSILCMVCEVDFSCSKCAVGFKQPLPGQASCEMCPLGKTSPEGSVACSDCPTGRPCVVYADLYMFVVSLSRVFRVCTHFP